MSDIASPPPSLAATAGRVMSEMFGVSFTMTGVFATSFTQLTIVFNTLGSCPTADPIPLSHIPCGQPKFNSNPSAPAFSASRTIWCHSSRDSTMSEAITA